MLDGSDSTVNSELRTEYGHWVSNVFNSEFRIPYKRACSAAEIRAQKKIWFHLLLNLYLPSDHWLFWSGLGQRLEIVLVSPHLARRSTRSLLSLDATRETRTTPASSSFLKVRFSFCPRVAQGRQAPVR